MAQETIVRYVDDLDGSEDVAETVEFGLRNKRYVIDLNAKNVQALEESLADFIAAARPAAVSTAGKGAPNLRKIAKAGSVRADREQTQAIREWARQNGHQVSDRGRVPKSVLDAFQAAH
jgi:hypothetical protein